MPERFEDYSRPLVYARPEQRGRPLRPRTIIGAILASLFGLALLAWSVLIPTTPGVSKPQADRLKCASNMRQIGVAITVYAQEHGGQFPDDLETLLKSEDLTPAAFVCPQSDDTPGIAPTTQAAATARLGPGHLSYVYLGKGLTTKTVANDIVLLYEPLTNHASSGMNAMFGDFHVEWLTISQAKTMLSQQAAGTQPVKASGGS